MALALQVVSSPNQVRIESHTLTRCRFPKACPQSHRSTSSIASRCVSSAAKRRSDLAFSTPSTGIEKRNGTDEFSLNFWNLNHHVLKHGFPFPSCLRSDFLSPCATRCSGTDRSIQTGDFGRSLRRGRAKWLGISASASLGTNVLTNINWLKLWFQTIDLIKFSVHDFWQENRYTE